MRNTTALLVPAFHEPAFQGDRRPADQEHMFVIIARRRFGAVEAD